MGAGVVGTSATVSAITAVDLYGPNSSTTTQNPQPIIGGVFDHNGQGDTLACMARWDPAAQRWVQMGAWNPPSAGVTPIRFLRPWTQTAGQAPTTLVTGSLGNARGVAVVTSGVPYITSYPGAQVNACSASNVTLAATVLGGSLVYRWQRNGANLFNGATGTGSSLAGVDTASLVITHAGPGDNGTYTLNVFSPCGNVTTAATVLTAAACCGSADFNCDGSVGTDADIESFFACLGGTCPPPPCTSTADFNGDGATGTDADIESFFRVLSGGPC
jgi:hypothetical protein